MISLKGQHTKPPLEGLSEALYVRERINPRFGDPFYLHLSDLLLVLRSYATAAEIKILDFGCGGCPYCSLFPNAEYFRADFGEVPDIDYQIDNGGRLRAAPDDFFDMVLSTQVLEHCSSPKTYLEECQRTLKKGGLLLLSTHGMFEDHGCPYDYHRWTEDGLRSVLDECGFRVVRIVRLTMGPRAGIMLLQRALVPVTKHEGSQLRKLVWWQCRRFLLLRRRFWDPLLDWALPEYRFSNGQPLPGDNLYIGLFAVAER